MGNIFSFLHVCMSRLSEPTAVLGVLGAGRGEQLLVVLLVGVSGCVRDLEAGCLLCPDSGSRLPTDSCGLAWAAGSPS